MSEAAKEAAPVRSLVKKLAEVKGAVDRIAKNGHNDHFNYDFATESDIAAAVRKEMADRHLVMFPNVTKTEWEKVPRKNGETKLCTLTVEFTVEDGDSGETRRFTILGQGEDSMDKATYKAMTGAEKYALLKLFMIPTGDDPEKSESEGLRHTPRNEKQGAPRQEAAPKSDGGEEVRVPYGNSSGKLLSEVTEKDLEFLLKATSKSINDPAKARFKDSNQKFLEAVQREAQRRITHATGKISAPATTSQRQAELLAEDEGEEILTASQRFFQLARESGLSGAQLTARAKGVLNKTAGWTHADIDLLTASLRAVPA